MNADSRARSNLRSQLRETVRASILDAAEELIATRGLHGAALAQIAKRAGVAVGTLYNYFEDRDALVRGLFESRRAVLRPQLKAAAEAAADLPFEPRLRQFVHAMLEVTERHRTFLKVAIETEYVKVAPPTTPHDLHVLLTEIVAAGVAEKTVSKAHAEVLPMLVAGALKGVIVRRVADGKPFTDAAETIVAIFLDGIRGAR